MDTNSKIPQLSDHFLVAFIFGNLVNQVLGCDAILQDQVTDRQEYPFVTFNFVILDQEETSDWKHGHNYRTMMQIDCHATDAFSAMSMAQKLYESLHMEGYRRFFTQAHVVPQNIDRTASRTILEGINYDYDYGFDVTYLLQSGVTYQAQDLSFVFNETTIESTNAVDMTTNSNVYVKKEDN